MGTIHQIYSTHCTFGSSAIERRSGDLASRVMGYGARASSLGREKLAEYYAQLEPLVYYFLPPDTPREKSLEATADSSPRRLFYYPSVGGKHAVGQVCFRKTDTAGRPGSYFGHVLLDEQDDRSWSVLKCLKLWGAPWVEEDSPAHPHDLDAFPSLDAFRSESPVALGDDVLRSFLSTPRGQAFDDPQDVIPARWRDVEASQREALMIDVLAGYLELRSSGSRKSVLLVVEPGVAALLFYGVARLLPEGPIREEVSFSTFEPQPDLITTSLAATVFYTPDKTDLDAQVYHGNGFVCNTFSGRWSQRRPQHRLYAHLVVEELLEGDWAAANSLLAGFQAAGPASAGDLEVLAQTRPLMLAVLDAGSPLGQDVWQSRPAAKQYFMKGLRGQLAAASAEPEKRLSPLLGKARQWELLVLTSGSKQSPGEAEPAVRYLLYHLPESSFAKLWKSKAIASHFKFDYLVHFVNDKQRFPKGCEALWQTDEQTGKLRSPGAVPILTSVLSRIEPEVLEAIFSGLAPSQQEGFLAAIAAVWPNVPDPKRSTCAVGFVRVVESLPKDRLIFFLHRYAETIEPCYPESPKIEQLLQGMLDDLHRQTDHFSEWLDVLESWIQHFPDVSKVEERIASWTRTRSLILKGPDRAEDLPKRLSQHMSDAVKDVSPRMDHSDKCGCLQAIARALLGKDSFLQKRVWKDRVDDWLKKRHGESVPGRWF